jgi:polysaccharide export outer membrane protein
MPKNVISSILIIITLIVSIILYSCAGNVRPVETLVNYQEAEQSITTSKDSYVIGPGDILSIDIWKEPDLSKQQVTVRLDGKISLPLLNEIKVSGLSCIDLRNQLQAKYKDYVDVPQVSVTLVESHSKKIYLLGNVANQGEYELRKNMTIMQAISLAGGLNQWADTSDIRLIRRIKGVEKIFRIDYDVIVSGNDFSQNIQLRPDDTIYVP